MAVFSPFVSTFSDHRGKHKLVLYRRFFGNTPSCVVRYKDFKLYLLQFYTLPVKIKMCLIIIGWSEGSLDSTYQSEVWL